MAREDIYTMARALSRDLSRARRRVQRDCPILPRCPPPYQHSSLYGFWSRVPNISSPSLLDFTDTTGADLVLDTVGSAKQEIDTAHIDHAIRSATANRRFFLTKSGYMGIAPPSTLVDDKVYVFSGGRTPFIVRKIDFDPGESFHYTLIGDCYLHGVMDGEALSRNYGKQGYISLM